MTAVLVILVLAWMMCTPSGREALGCLFALAFLAVVGLLFVASSAGL